MQPADRLVEDLAVVQLSVLRRRRRNCGGLNAAEVVKPGRGLKREVCEAFASKPLEMLDPVGLKDRLEGTAPGRLTGDQHRIGGGGKFLALR